jgi:hypothetical protein
VDGIDRRVDPLDLVRAIDICSHTFEDGPDYLFPPDGREVDLEHIEMPTTNKVFDPAKEGFETYIANYTSFPRFWSPDSEGRVSGIPAPFLAVSYVLRRMTGLSEVEAWDMPYSRLICYKCAIQEEFGYYVRTPEEQAASEILKAQAAAEALAAQEASE